MGLLDNLFHVEKLEYVRKWDVDWLNENYATGNIDGIFLLPGKVWSTQKLSPSESVFVEKQIREATGVHYVQKFIGHIPATAIEFPLGVKAITDEPIFCKLTLVNGSVLFIGRSMNPVHMTYEFNTAEQKYLIKFSHKSDLAAQFVV